MTANSIAAARGDAPPGGSWNLEPAAAAAYEQALRTLPDRLQATLFRLMDGGEVAEPSPSEADWKLLHLLATAGVRDADTLAELWRSSAIADGREGKVERLARRTVARVLAATERKWRTYAARARMRELEAGPEPEPLRVLTADELADPSLLRVPDAIGPWLTWRGELTYFPGREKLGKSTLAASDARGVARAGGRFMWVTAEESRNRVVKRLRDLGIPLGAMLVPDRWPRSWEEVEALVAATRPDAVYVDSLASFLAAAGERIPDTSEGEAWHGLVLRFKRLATVGRSAGDQPAGVCVLEHATKEDGSYRGSTGKGAAPDTIVTFRAVAGDDSARRLDVVGRWGFPSRSVRFAGDQAGYEDATPGRPSEADEHAAAVVAAYRPGIKIKEWMAATGLPETTFYRVRRAAMEERQDGTWGLRRPDF